MIYRVKRVNNLEVLFESKESYLFVWGFTSNLRIFHSYGDLIITDEWLQIFTYARQSWPLSSESFLAFIMVISEEPWHSYLLPRVWQWSCHYLFLRHRYVAAGIRTISLPHARLTLSTAAVKNEIKHVVILFALEKRYIKVGCLYFIT